MRKGTVNTHCAKLIISNALTYYASIVVALYADLTSLRWSGNTTLSTSPAPCVLQFLVPKTAITSTKERCTATIITPRNLLSGATDARQRS